MLSSSSSRVRELIKYMRSVVFRGLQGRKVGDQMMKKKSILLT